MFMKFLVLKASLAMMSAMLLIGCGGPSTPADDEMVERTPERFRFGNLPYDSVERETIDLSEDGSADQTYFRRDGVLLWTERDLNFNGQPDLIEYYDANGVVIEREFVLGHSDEVTAIHFFRDGQIVRKELRASFDGREMPIWQYFDGQGQMLRLERDSNFNGRVDVWEYYEDGQLVRVGRDMTDDGSPDTFETVSRAR